jgi:hypothetical protein
MRAAAVFVVVSSVLLATAHRAGAECATPSWIGTESSSVPTRGSLYVYEERQGDSPDDQSREVQHDVTWTGIAGVAIQNQIARGVVRIDYAGSTGSVLVVNGVRYRLIADWRPPVEAPRILESWNRRSEWTCSYTDTMNIKLDQPTAAVRVRWTYRGRTTETIVPTKQNVLVLGKINCGGMTLDPVELRVGGQLELFAIRLDGSEVPIGPALPASSSTVFYVLVFGVLAAIPLLIIWYRRGLAAGAWIAGTS